MNDKRFKSLINLYIDNEITPEEREEFQREIARDSGRRALYEEYAWMQRASEVVLKRFESDIEESLPCLSAPAGAADVRPVERRRLPERRVLYGAAALFLLGGTFFLTLSNMTDPTSELVSEPSGGEFYASAPGADNLPPLISGDTLTPALSPSKVHPILSSDEAFFSLTESGDDFDFSLRTPIEPAKEVLANKRIFSSRTFLESPSPEMASFVFRR